MDCSASTDPELADSLALAHLQLCDPLNDGRPGLNFIGLRSVNGIAEQRFNPSNWSHSSLHPYERGHAAMLRVFENWLATTPHSEASNPEFKIQVAAYDAKKVAAKNSGTKPVKLTDDKVAPCGLYDATKSGCRPQGTTWAYKQVGGLLRFWGVAVLLAAAAVWFFAVAFFASRRRKFYTGAGAGPPGGAPQQPPSVTPAGR